MGPGGPGGTHEDLDGLRWENMGSRMHVARTQCSTRCHVLVILLVFVATVINMEARKVDLNKVMWEPETSRASGLRGMQLGAKRAVDARATLLLGKGVVQDSECS